MIEQQRKDTCQSYITMFEDDNIRFRVQCQEKAGHEVGYGTTHKSHVKVGVDTPYTVTWATSSEEW